MSDPASTASGATTAGLVVGASSGVGRCLTRLLLRDGPVVAASRRLVPEEPGLTSVSCDVRDPASVEGLFESFGDRPLSYVVNCAAVGFYAPLDADHSREWEEIVRTNVLGLVHLLSSLLRFQPECPRFVQVGSMASRRPSPTPGNAVYSATKTAALPLLEHFRNELRARGRCMRVTLLTPGFIRGTGFGENFFRHAPEAERDLFDDAPALHPEQCAEAIAAVLGADPALETLETVIAPPPTGSLPFARSVNGGTHPHAGRF